VAARAKEAFMSPLKKTPQDAFSFGKTRVEVSDFTIELIVEKP
jgi:hypothetical protein